MPSPQVTTPDFQERFEARQAAPTGVPLVSILIPAYNHADFVEDCLESIARDEYPAKEIVLVDDGSSDVTFALSRAWLDRNQSRFVRVLALRQRNQGVSRTLNRLVAMAEGSYIALVASDDALLPGGIEARVRVLEGSDRWYGVFADAEVMGTRGELLADSALDSLYATDKSMLLNPSSMATELLLRWAIPGPVLLMRRVAYDAVIGIGPYSEDLAVEDRDFYLRLLAARRLRYLDQRVARYRIHQGNASRARAQQAAVARNLLSSERRNVDRFTGVDRVYLALSMGSNYCFLKSREAPRVFRIAFAGAYLMFRLVVRTTLAVNRRWNAAVVAQADRGP